MDKARTALDHLNKRMKDRSPKPPITYEEFLRELSEQPTRVLRNVFQVLYDMVNTSLGSGRDDFPDDPESIHYMDYETSRLFESDTDRPFFADRLFANRLVNVIGAMKRGTQQNKIYIFNGPPGCGKSTFLNNLLKKFENYANSDGGLRYEVLWRLDPSLFGPIVKRDKIPILENLASILEADGGNAAAKNTIDQIISTPQDVLEIACPSHDNPILITPRDYRTTLLQDLLGNSPDLEAIFTQKEFTWVFKDKPCTFCSSLYRLLLNTLKNARDVHQMIYARPYNFSRRMGRGITVFNPGDITPEDMIVRNPELDKRINTLAKRETDVQYIYSRYAKTNNGIYALMDIKSHNTERLIELHNIISEGIHKVEEIEENVNSLLLAVMNPEDQENIRDFRSFSDRIEYINIPYVLDVNTEVKIYRSIFGKPIENRFLPRVLENFARVIISTRMNRTSDALSEWIHDARKYNLYCDENLQLLKMEIYCGVIPAWLTEEDRKKLNAKRRRRIIAESDKEGNHGISGRDSIKVFNDFFSAYGKQDKMINMSMLCDFFRKSRKEVVQHIPSEFIDSLVRMYNYTVLQEVKESLYYYNYRQISQDILNYLFAINFEPPTVEVCTYTKERLEITETFFELMEKKLLGMSTSSYERRRFREETQREYTSRTLTQEMMVEDKPITQTTLYTTLSQRYEQNLKAKVLDPFLDNENFRRAIKEYDTKDFKAYDKRIRDDIKYLTRNLQKKFGYTEQGAREVCIYVIDNDLARKFGKED